MERLTNLVRLRQPDDVDDPLTEVLRAGARRLLAQAVELEADDFLAAMQDLRLPDGRARLVRHGHGPERQIHTGIGPVPVARVKIRDRGSEATEKRIGFSSKILPKWARRTRSLDALLPVLYLRGISTGDFQDALGALLGKDAPNLSPSVIGRLTAEWQAEYERWQGRDLSARRYVYVWADGVYLQARMEDQAECMLVLIGATPEGKKELVGFQVGVRESTQSWRELLVDVKRRGLAVAPEQGVEEVSRGALVGVIHSSGIGLEVDLRGSDEKTGALFSYVDLEARVRTDHPLRSIRMVVNEALGTMEADFAALYSRTGRPSIPPEKLLRAMLLQAFYSIRSERQLMERLEFDLLFRWFVGLGIDDPAWDHSTFSKNRDRLLEGAVAGRLLTAILAQPRVKRLLSTEHFSVDGTLIEAWASMKSFKPVEGPDDQDPPTDGRNTDADFRGETRSNATHASTTDPEAKLYRKGPGMEARLCFLGHALMENRSGLLVSACLTQANGHAERLAALAMIEARANRPVALTLAADKGYDAADFVNELRSLNVRPHVAQNTTRRRGRSAIDGRTTRHPGYVASQRVRKRIEEAFGWMKTVAGMRRPMLRGVDRVGWAFTFAAAAYNLVRLPRLLAEQA